MQNIPPEKIIEFIEKHFDYKLRKNGTRYRINNPLVYDDGYHLEIGVNDGTCHDWRGDSWTGYKKDGSKYKCTFIRLVQLYLNCSYFNAIKEVLGKGIDPKQYLNGNKQLEIVKPEIDIKFPQTHKFGTGGKLEAIVKNWLVKTRHLSDDLISKYDISYYGMVVVWPYYEFGELVYWQSRSITDKIFNFPPESAGVTKGQFLYGFDFVEPATYILITEAIIDAISVNDQCVATGGAALTVDQVKKIKLLGPKDGVILVPDNDVFGMQSILSNAKLLEPYYKVYYCIPPRNIGKDWNDVLKSGINPRDYIEDNVKYLSDNDKINLMRDIHNMTINKRSFTSVASII